MRRVAIPLAFVGAIALIAAMLFRLSQRVVAIDVERALLCEDIPVTTFAKRGVMTPLDKWRKAIVKLSRGDDVLFVRSEQVFVVPCESGSQVRDLLIYTAPLSQETLAAKHGEFIKFIQSPEQAIAFAEWLASEKNVLFSTNKFEQDHVYHWSILRTYDTAAPWRAKIGIGWRCEEMKRRGTSEGGPRFLR